MREAADHLKRLSLELGGKNPMIVFPDVDIDKAAQGCIRGMNLARSMGQSCQSNSRVFVHEKIYDRFVGALVERVARLKIGDPREETTVIGPVNHKKHYDRILGFIRSGKEEGAKLAIGGGRPSHLNKGYYVEPTVFTDVTMDMRIAKEDIFGPVVSVLSWSDFDKVIEEANGVEYGLTANIWTNDLTPANKAAKRVQSGLVWINGSGGRVAGVPFWAAISRAGSARKATSGSPELHPGKDHHHPSDVGSRGTPAPVCAACGRRCVAPIHLHVAVHHTTRPSGRSPFSRSRTACTTLGSSKNSITRGKSTMIWRMSAAWTSPASPKPAMPRKTVTPLTLC